MYLYAHTQKNRSGFSLVELLVVISIVLIISALSFLWFPSYIKKERVKKEMNVLAANLEEARSQTLSAKNSSQYGVRTETNQIIFFEGSSYVAGAPNNRIHAMDSGVIVSMGAGQTFVFEKLTGRLLDYPDFYLINLSSSDYAVTKSVIIYLSGLIEKN